MESSINNMGEPFLDQIQRDQSEKLNQIKKAQHLPEERNQHYKFLTAAYEDFKDRLCYKYLLTYDSSDFGLLQKKMNMIQGNSSAEEIMVKRGCSLLLSPLLCIPFIYWNSRTVFEVEQNHFALVINQSESGKKTLIYGPGYHILGYFNRLQGVYSFHQNYPNNIIESEIGDLKIARVNQGSIMSFECSGQNLILPPGIHKINDPLIYQNTISLDSFYIQIGPERWITIPDGYDGISVNRGKIKVLEGGKQHHLAHVGEKFVKMLPKILQTDKVTTDVNTYIQTDQMQLQKGSYNKQDPSLYLQTTTIEGAFISLDVMIFWNIVDSEKAVKNGMEILNSTEDYQNINQQKAIQDAQKNITHLRQTVLRIAKNHICSLVSTCSISQKHDSDKNQKEDIRNSQNTFEILSVLQHKEAYLKQTINDDLEHIGCLMKTVCVYSVTPQQDIQVELDKQTKAKVDAKTAIIQVQNRQQTNLIELELQNEISLKQAQANANITRMNAEAQAQAQILKSKAEAEGIIMVAKARKEEAEQLQETEIAKELERIRVIGNAGEKIFQGGSNNFVFGNNPGDVMYSMFQKMQNSQTTIDTKKT